MVKSYVICVSFFLGILAFSSTAFAAISLYLGSNSVAPVNNLQLNFTWTNSTVVENNVTSGGNGYNGTSNITFTLPAGILYIASSAGTNSTPSSILQFNSSSSSPSFVEFGNWSANDTSSLAVNFTFNVSATSAGTYTIIENETYMFNGTTRYIVNNTVTLQIINGTLTLTNQTFSNYTYNGNTLQMNFTASQTSPTDKAPANAPDNISYNLYLNGLFENTSFTNGTSNTVIANFTANGTAQIYTFVFNTTGDNNYTSTSITAYLNISKAIPDVNVYLNNATVNVTVTYPNSFEIRGNSSVSVNPPTFNLSVANSSGVIFLSTLGNSSVINATLGNGTYQVFYNTSSNQNYTTVSNSSLFVFMNKGSPSLTLSFSPSSSVGYGTPITVTGNGCPTFGANDASCTLTRTDPSSVTTTVGNPDTGVSTANLNAGSSYTYTFTSATSANWTTAMISGILAIGSTSSGGGSSGGSSGASATVTTGQVAINVNSVSPGSPAAVLVSNSDTGLTELDVNVVNTLSTVGITVSNSQLPIGSPFPTGNAYQKWSVAENNIRNSDIAQIIFKFKVSKTWLTSNNVDPNSITLMRLSNNQWTSLTTTKTSEDANFVYYSASSPGLSYFAITGNTVQTTSTTSTTSQTPTETSSTSASTQIPVSYNSNTTMMFAVAAILIVVFIAALMVLRKKKTHTTKE